MPIYLDHTIVPATDKEASARFFAKIFGLEYKGPWGHFAPVRVNETLSLDFDNRDVVEQAPSLRLHRLGRGVRHDPGPRQGRRAGLRQRADAGRYADQPPAHRPRLLLQRPQRPPLRGHYAHVHLRSL